MSLGSGSLAILPAHVITRTNVQNDALLHRLVHTKLLSGSLDPELDLTPAKRKKALEGRILEAAGKAKLGKGEAAVRQAERNRAAKNVRDGLNEKQQERRQKELEEVNPPAFLRSVRLTNVSPGKTSG